MIKTTKSYSKRLKLTKNGKILSRKSGQNHFRSRKNRRTQLKNKRSADFPFPMNNKVKARFLNF